MAILVTITNLISREAETTKKRNLSIYRVGELVTVIFCVSIASDYMLRLFSTWRYYFHQYILVPKTHSKP